MAACGWRSGEDKHCVIPPSSATTQLVVVVRGGLNRWDSGEWSARGNFRDNKSLYVHLLIRIISNSFGALEGKYTHTCTHLNQNCRTKCFVHTPITPLKAHAGTINIDGSTSPDLVASLGGYTAH